MSAFSDYLADVRRLVHDSTDQFSSQAEKLILINKARKRVVRDSGAYRVLQSLQYAAAGLETFAYGGVIGVQIVNGGTGFPGTSQAVTFTGGGGTGATGTATIASGVVTAIAITAQGTGYTSAPAVSVAGGGINFSGVAGFIHAQTIDMVNLSRYALGNASRDALIYWPFTKFNARARYLTNYVGTPQIFTSYSYNSVFVAPKLDQTYAFDFDCVRLPPDIVDDTTVEVIPEPFNEPVGYYAAYLLKVKEQSWGEADAFKMTYDKQILASINSAFTRRLINPYKA